MQFRKALILASAISIRFNSRKFQTIQLIFISIFLLGKSKQMPFRLRFLIKLESNKIDLSIYYMLTSIYSIKGEVTDVEVINGFYSCL